MTMMTMKEIQSKSFSSVLTIVAVMKLLLPLLLQQLVPAPLQCSLGEGVYCSW